MTLAPGQGLPELLQAIAGTVERLQFSRPEFRLDIGWAPTYDSLFSGNLEKAGEDSVLDTALRKGRCIVTGRGGGGKTQMLHRLMRAAFGREIVAVLVDLKNWTKRDYGDWSEWTASDVGAGASFLLERFSQPAVDALALDYLPPSTRKLLIVDGLNEIAAPVGHEVLLALDQIASTQIGLSILVADRLTRRSLPSPLRWALATVLPLSKEVIAEHCGDGALASPEADSLKTPYFLDAAIRKEEVTESPSETHRRFMRDHGGLQDPELDRVAAAAYRLYYEAGTRTFPAKLLADLVGEDLAKQLRQSGTVVSAEQSGEAQFAHHLLHDYLAARHVAAMPSQGWSREVLQTISFDGASFDTISMVLSQLHEDAADAFLRSLYDWNPYAAAYALTDTSEMALGPSVEMQQVIFAMLAEKRFDIVEPTKQRATDALAIIHASSAEELKASTTMTELLATVGRMKSEKDWFKKWAALFVSPPEGQLADGDLECIREADSIYGWTVANVARRVRLTDQQLQVLRGWLADERPVVRWRIAHILGSHPSDANASALKQLLRSDGDSDVKYGAVRSLVEMAAKAEDEQVRQGIAAFLAESAPVLVLQKKVKEELKRALLLVCDRAPPSWWGLVAAVAKSVYAAEDDPAEREAWRRYVDLASARYMSP
jgi:hypothetical protein